MNARHSVVLIDVVVVLLVVLPHIVMQNLETFLVFLRIPGQFDDLLFHVVQQRLHGGIIHYKRVYPGRGAATWIMGFASWLLLGKAAHMGAARGARLVMRGYNT